MSTTVRIVNVHFTNFKGLSEFRLDVGRVNLLVGPNNCGKSTIVGAFRALDVGVKRAQSKSPQRVETPRGGVLAYSLSADDLPLSLENVHTDYADADSSVTFALSNGNSLELWFPQRGGRYLIPRAGPRQPRSPSDFRREFPITLATVPVLGPVEHKEELLTEETVRRSLGTHRASRHFRNYWRLYPDGFGDFANLVAETWPDMEIQRPEIVMGAPPTIAMFCKEKGLIRELYWAGFGFQIWCQLLTHIARSKKAGLLVIDEPEVYLHPDLQRKLLGVLHAAGPELLVATHSTELIAEADTSEVVEIDKASRRARRLRDIDGVQELLDAIGSIHNITLTKIARNRRVLFVEGSDDFARLRRFARRLGLAGIASGELISPVQAGGFSTWVQVKHMAGLLEKSLGAKLRIAALYDRDYWPTADIEKATRELEAVAALAHFHSRKEMENYLLVPTVLQRVLTRAGAKDIQIEELLAEITNPMRSELLGQYLAKHAGGGGRGGVDAATGNVQTIEWFEAKWASIDRRMEIVCGKEVLSLLRAHAKSSWNVSLSDAQIIEAFQRADVPTDLSDFLVGLEKFCQT